MPASQLVPRVPVKIDKVPVVSIPAEKGVEHFGPFFGHIVAVDMPASSAWTRKTLG